MVGDEDYCEMAIQMPAELATLGGVVDILYGPQGLTNGATVVLK